LPKAKASGKIVDALLALATERPFDEVSLTALAERAAVPLADVRAQYDGRVAVLADYIRQTDERVLGGIDASLASEPLRERLFDILCARFDAHAPHKKAVESIVRAARRDLPLALELNRLVTISMGWMLEAAGISATGGRGALRAQGLALVWARAMRVWLHDDGPDMARTMAALDKGLRRAERVIIAVHKLEKCVPRRRPRTRTPQPSTDADLAEGHPT
jgi:AcrR family transcriptional regulator